MDIEYNGLDGRPLCFYHAVKTVMEKDEKVSADAPSHSSDANDWTGYLGQTCVECFPPDVEDGDYDED